MLVGIDLNTVTKNGLEKSSIAVNIYFIKQQIDPKFLQQKNKTDDGSEDIERTTWKKEMNVLFIL